ncbi:hypothetical protein DB346_20615 [Verrucomicrobia bacterium LW23]|nr:hypothetical protein DB346_20615 [Verrucomicrobia bacterium LW23]
MYGQDRTQEHGLLLRWLLEVIRTERVEGIIIAGDVFDCANPPQSALRQYYDFLGEVIALQCHALIIGGNHDSGQMLNAPRDLLRSLGRIHVHGVAADDPRESLIRWPSAQEPEVVLCACPFLREGDLRRSAVAETQRDVRQRLRAGLLAHYAALRAASNGYRQAGVPVIATGHLTVSGTATGEGEREIHLGAGDLVSGADLSDPSPEESQAGGVSGFHYVALGHIHRAQTVGNKEHIRYSGSPIPLSFSEAEDHKQVVLLDTLRADAHRGTEATIHIRSIAVPTWRRLLRWSGTLNEVCEAIRGFQPTDGELEAWADVRVESDLAPQVVDASLDTALAGKALRILRRRRIEALTPVEQPAFAEMRIDLHELTPEDVFTQKLADEGLVADSEDVQRLRLTFAELLEKHRQAAAR